MVKNLPANVEGVSNVSLIPGSGRSSGGEHGNPLQHSCLENPVVRGAWWATVHRVAKIWTGLKEFSTHAQLIYNVVFVSSVQQSDSVIPIHIPMFFQILFPYMIIIEYSGVPCSMQ